MPHLTTMLWIIIPVVLLFNMLVTKLKLVPNKTEFANILKPISKKFKTNW